MKTTGFHPCQYKMTSDDKAAIDRVDPGLAEVFMSKKNLFLSAFISFIFIFSFGPVSAQNEAKKWTLDECLAVAEKNNPALVSARYKMLEMEAQYRQNLASILPQLDGNLGYLRYDKELPSKKAMFGDSPDDFTAGISLKQMIFSGGKNLSKINSIKASIEAEKYNLEMVRRSIRLSVTKAYFEQARNQFSILAQNESLAYLKEQERIVRLLYNSGKTSSLDVLRLQAQVATAEQNLEDLKSAGYTRSLLLGQSMGIKEPVLTDASESSLSVENSGVNDKCNGNAFTNYPGLKAIKLSIKKSSSDISSVIGEFYPTLYFRGDYFLEDRSFFPGNPNWDIGLQLTMPIFHGGEILARVNQAQYRKKQVEESFTNELLKISTSFQTAYAAVRNRFNRLKATKNVLALSKEVLTTSRLKYNTGKITVTELLDSQSLWLNSNLAYIDNLIDYRIAIAELESICPESIGQEE